MQVGRHYSKNKVAQNVYLVWRGRIITGRKNAEKRIGMQNKPTHNQYHEKSKLLATVIV